MDYQQTIDYLFNQLPVFQVIGPGAYKPGLDTAYKLSAAFGNPHQSFKAIHIAGTNGKGSTSHALASILYEAGYKVGLYTSPHIFDFRERIRVDGEKITHSAVTDFVERYLSMGLDCRPSFFELTTIMAFDYFRSCGVDIAVIETGLGGRLDTTNIITPVMSIITNISLDHTSLLGHTEAEIAAEKAGIIKAGVPVVIGEASADVRQVFADRAAAVGAPIVFAQDSQVAYSMSADGSWIYGRRAGYCPDIPCDLRGTFQPLNINTVLNALDAVRLADDSAVRRGLGRVLTNTHLIGRWMTVDIDGHEVVLDTGHNLGAWRGLSQDLTRISEERELHVVLGFCSDKDVDGIFDMLPHGATYYFVTPSVKRGRRAAELKALANDRGFDGGAYDSVADGIGAALGNAAPESLIFVGGSNFVVADLPIDIG